VLLLNKIYKIGVFWNIMSCRMAYSCQHFEGASE